MAKKSTDDDKKKGSKPKMIAALVIALVGYKFLLAPKAAPPAEGAVRKEGSVVALPELTINLADSEARYLRTGIALVYWEGEGAGGGGHGAAAGGDDKDASIASDIAVDVLSGKKYSELKSTEGKQHAKDEITERLKHDLHETVARILFTSFVMQ